MQILKYSGIVIFIPLIIGVIKFNQLNKDLKIVLFFVIFGAATEVFTKFYSTFWMKNTMPIGHIYLSLSFLLMGLFYLGTLKSFVNKNLLIGSILIFELFSIINVVFIQSIFEFANITGAVSAMILVVFSIMFYSKVMSESKIVNLSHEPILWINTAVLIYYTGNFFYYILFNYSLRISTEFAITTVKFSYFINILFYLLIAAGFWKVKRVKSELY